MERLLQKYSKIGSYVEVTSSASGEDITGVGLYVCLPVMCLYVCLYVCLSLPVCLFNFKQHNRKTYILRLKWNLQDRSEVIPWAFYKKTAMFQITMWIQNLFGIFKQMQFTTPTSYCCKRLFCCLQSQSPPYTLASQLRHSVSLVPQFWRRPSQTQDLTQTSQLKGSHCKYFVTDTTGHRWIPVAKGQLLSNVSKPQWTRLRQYMSLHVRLKVSMTFSTSSGNPFSCDHDCKATHFVSYVVSRIPFGGSYWQFRWFFIGEQFRYRRHCPCLHDSALIWGHVYDNT